MEKVVDSHYYHPVLTHGEVAFYNTVAIPQAEILNTEWFEPVVEWWKPKEKQDYWFIDVDGDLIRENYQFNDSVIVKTGNCFRTKEAALDCFENYIKPAILKYHEEKGE